MASVATKCLHFGMTEHEDVGLWRSHRPNIVASVSPKIWLTLRVHFFGSQIENINVFCLLRLVNYCTFLFGNRRT